MPIDFSNVNVTIQQFQKIASGKYNAGEIRLTGRNSLGKVNNHVTQISSRPIAFSAARASGNVAIVIMLPVANSNFQ